QTFDEAIHARGLAGSTAIILSAKHGQSPQDPNQLTRIKDGPIIEAINAAWKASHPTAGNLIVAGVDDDAWQSYLSDTSQQAADFVKEYLWNHPATGIAYDGSERTLALGSERDLRRRRGGEVLRGAQERSTASRRVGRR